MPYVASSRGQEIEIGCDRRRDIAPLRATGPFPLSGEGSGRVMSAQDEIKEVVAERADIDPRSLHLWLQLLV